VEHRQHYDQEYDFPELDPLLVPPRVIELIPEAAPSRRQSEKRYSHHPPLPRLLLANVQSLDNKVDELRARISFQRDIRDFNILCFMESRISRDIMSPSIQPAGFSVHRADRNKNDSLGRRNMGVYVS
jgi:hypothetical protein